MLAVKVRRPSDYVARPLPVPLAASSPVPVRLVDSGTLTAAPSPARALQAELVQRMSAPPGAATSGPGLSLRGRAAMICAAVLVSWLPLAAGAWLLAAG
jgi:hypothetical protein